MNIQRILTDIADQDPEVYERLSPRRATIRTFLRGASLAALPIALGGLFKKAYGQGNQNNQLIIDTLNFALLPEYLESSFYTTAMNTPTLTTQFNALDVRQDVQLLMENENAHRDFLITTIRSLGGTPISPPTFDYTGGKGQGNGPFPDVLITAGTFFAVAQAFEDTGVRAYKGQATNLMSNNDILTAALNIHSVEARHAARLRMIRMMKLNVDVKPWITGTQSGISQPAAAPVYAGEDNVLQGTATITALPNAATGNTISLNVATESFDEPITKDQATAILSNFIVS